MLLRNLTMDESKKINTNFKSLDAQQASSSSSTTTASNGSITTTKQQTQSSTNRQHARAIQQSLLQTHGLEPQEWPDGNTKLADIVSRIRSKPQHTNKAKPNRPWKQELLAESDDASSCIDCYKDLTREQLLHQFKSCYEEALTLATSEREIVTEINQLSRCLYTNNNISTTQHNISGSKHDETLLSDSNINNNTTLPVSEKGSKVGGGGDRAETVYERKS